MISELPATKKGDIYFIKEDDKYTLYKVASVSDNEIIFKGNKKTTKSSTKAITLGREDKDFDMAEPVRYTKEELL